jgi:hypothetical protein
VFGFFAFFLCSTRAVPEPDGEETTVAHTNNQQYCITYSLRKILASQANINVRLTQHAKLKIAGVVSSHSRNHQYL